MKQEQIHKLRTELRLSQSALARLSKVPRVRICLHEMGDCQLKQEEVDRIAEALKKEVTRLSQVKIPDTVDDTTYKARKKAFLDACDKED